MQENIKSSNHFGKFPAITIIISVLCSIMERVLLTATTAPTYDGSPRRFLLYASMKTIVLVGINLLSIWLGFYGEKYLRINFFSKLAKCWLVFVGTMIFTFVIFFFLRGSLNFKDLWVILFPISQNYFGFSVSFILLFLFFPYIVMLLNRLDTKQFQRLLFLWSVAAVILPSLFGKDVWNYNGGKSILWQLYLVILGYGIKRLGLMKRFRFLLPQLALSIFLLCGAIFVMANISIIYRGDASTAERFSVPYSIFSVYYTLVLFFVLERIQTRVNLQLYPGLLAILLVVSQVILNNGITNWNVSVYYRLPANNSLTVWLFGIMKFFGLYVGIILLWSLVIWGISHLSLVKRLEERLSVHSISEVFQRLKKLMVWIKSKKRLFKLIIFFYILVLVQMYAVYLATTNGSPNKAFLKYLFTGQPALWLNVAILMGIMMLIHLITNRFWYSFAFTTILYIVMTISSYLKLFLRQEPVLPGDIMLLSGINEIVTLVEPTLLIIGLVTMIILAVGAIFVQRRTQKMYDLKMNFKKRLGKIVLILFLFSGIFFANHRNSPPNLLLRTLGIESIFFNQVSAVRSNGPLVQFLLNIDVEVMNKPSGYSKEKIQEIMHEYDDLADEINQEREAWSEDQVVIFNLSESFSDPTRVPETTISSDPIPNIRSLKKTNTSGLMTSTGYGGGTANIEWETLSGLSLSSLAPTLPTPYSQLVENQAIAPNITNLFDNKVAIHPYVATLYNRVNVFKKYGFEAFYHVDSDDKLQYTDKISGSRYISDESAYKETLRLIDENGTGTQFIQLSTMQNHGSYTYTYPEYDFTFTGPSVVKNKAKEFQTYIQGVHYTDVAVKSFIEELDKIEKPITFVFYGDHLPSLYSGLSSTKYGLELHETDYFIYNNTYSRKHAKQDYGIVSPNYFSALALSQANLKVAPYYALLSELAEKVPAMTTDPTSSAQNRYNGAQVFVTDDGEVLDEGDLTKEQKAIFDDYRLIQYDLTVGEQYSAKWATQKVTK